MNNSTKKQRNSLADYFAFGEIFGYFFRKKDPNRPTSFSLKMMHGVNKISMLLFLFAVIVMIVRVLMRN